MADSVPLLRDVIVSLFDHMYWADRRLLDAAEGLSSDAFTAVSGATTRDLRSTLVHELDVEWSWRRRLHGDPMDGNGPDEELRADDFP